jgi:hypothetical protein
MAQIQLPAPGGQDAAFVSETDAAAFFHVHPRQLAHAAKRYAWLGRRELAGAVTYSQRGVAILGEMLEKNIVGREIFSRPPDSPRSTPRNPRKPPATRTDGEGGEG